MALFEGFEHRVFDSNGVRIPAFIGGSGPPVLLLHGNPFSRLSWHAVAPILAERFTVVATDLRGYGEASKPPGEADHANYSFRTMAADQLGVMSQLGFARFCCAGHDRGARVLYRMCLDRADRVERACFIDIMPTHHVFTNISKETATFSYHWYFMIQPFDFPERLMGADPEYFIRRKLSKTAAGTSFFHPDALAAYIRYIKDPATIHGMCEDYRAAAGVDFAMDTEDHEAGRRITQPVMLLWGANGSVGRHYDTARAWAGYAANIVTAKALPCGHYVNEECPEETAAALAGFFAGPPA